MLATRARDNVVLRRVRATRSAARTSSSSTDTRSCWTTRARCVARAPGFEEALLDRRRRPHGGGRPAAARRSPAAARERAGAGARGSRRSHRRAAGDQGATGRAARSRRCSTTSSRCGWRSSSGSRDYVEKNGFEEIVVGVSGGIDSALTAALAAEALGPERVHCVSMPSRYSSDETQADARKLAEKLGARVPGAADRADRGELRRRAA